MASYAMELLLAIEVKIILVCNSFPCQDIAKESYVLSEGRWLEMDIILVLPCQDTSNENRVENCPLCLGLEASENLVEVVIINITVGIVWPIWTLSRSTCMAGR